jgi:hypothetical protein
MAQGKKPPDIAATIVGHSVVGVVVALLAAQFLKPARSTTLVLALAGIMLHDMLDAPVAQAVSDAGI